jgi:hypothetical protein
MPKIGYCLLSQYEVGAFRHGVRLVPVIPAARLVSFFVSAIDVPSFLHRAFQSENVRTVPLNIITYFGVCSSCRVGICH